MKEKIKRAKEYLQQILQESLNEIYMFDADTLYFTYVNKGAITNIGYDPDEIYSMKPVDIKPEFDERTFTELLAPLKKGEKTNLVFETYLKRKDGSTYPVESHIQFVKEINMFISVKLDISERKKIEAEKEYLMHVLEESLNEIYMFDASSLLFTYVNKGALLNLGYSSGEMEKMTPLDINPEFTPESYEQTLIPLRNGNKKNVVFDTVHKRKDNSLYDVEVHLQLVNTFSQPVFVAIIADITDRKNFEKKLLHLNEGLEKKVEERTASLVSYQNQLRSLAFQLSKTKEQERNQLASFLHDNLGQVLAIMKMELAGVRKKQVDNSLVEYMNRLDSLVDDAIKYTRQLMTDLKPAPTGDDESLVSGIDWVAQKMKKYGLEVEIVGDKEDKPLSEEIKSLIIQSVNELLFNVVKHAEVNKAEIQIKRLNNHVQVSVIDKGHGFNAKNMNPEPTNMKGFGLFNLKEQIEWINGEMEILSEEGLGTEILLLSPLESEEQEEKVKALNGKRSSAHAGRDNKEKIKVLIADDHPMMREGLKKMISEQDDLEVIAEASNGREAVELAHQLLPDVIIMDINMPEMDGIEATRQLKNDHLPLRIIGLSFHKDDTVAQSILDAGASVYITKSDVFETLSATVRSEGMILRGSY